MAISDAGMAWAAVPGDQGSAVLWAFDGRGEPTSAPIETGRSARLLGIDIVSTGPEVLVVHVLCEEDGCRTGKVAVDTADVAEGKITLERRWTSGSIADPGAPHAFHVGDDVLGVTTAGVVLEFGKDGTAEVPFGGQQGDPCLVNGELVAVDAAIPVGEASGPLLSDEGAEPIVVVPLGGPAPSTWAGSETSFPRDSGQQIRCAADRLQVAEAGQPAVQTWSAEGGWETAAPRSIDWLAAPALDPYGLVGPRGDSLVRVDPASGETGAAVPLPAQAAAAMKAHGTSDSQIFSFAYALSRTEGPTGAVCLSKATAQHRVSEAECHVVSA